MQNFGEFAALGAAVCWSLASIPFTYAASRIGAPAVNAFKTTAAACILLPIVATAFGPAALTTGAPTTYALLAVSGVVGLAVADTALFHAYTEIGPRRTFLIFSASPFFAAALGRVFLDEPLGQLAITGMAVTTFGIVMVTLDKRPSATVTGHFGRGVACAFFAAVCMAAAGVTAKAALTRGELATFPAHALRMAAGAAGLLLVGIATGKIRGWVARLRSGPILARVGLGTVLGPIFGVWSFLLGLEHTQQTGIAMTLSALSPVLVIPLTWACHGDRPNGRAILGATIAIAGVGLLFWA